MAASRTDPMVDDDLDAMFKRYFGDDGSRRVRKVKEREAPIDLLHVFTTVGNKNQFSQVMGGRKTKSVIVFSRDIHSSGLYSDTCCLSGVYRAWTRAELLMLASGHLQSGVRY